MLLLLSFPSFSTTVFLCHNWCDYAFIEPRIHRKQSIYLHKVGIRFYPPQTPLVELHWVYCCCRHKRMKNIPIMKGKVIQPPFFRPEKDCIAASSTSLFDFSISSCRSTWKQWYLFLLVIWIWSFNSRQSLSKTCTPYFHQQFYNLNDWDNVILKKVT